MFQSHRFAAVQGLCELGTQVNLGRRVSLLAVVDLVIDINSQFVHRETVGFGQE